MPIAFSALQRYNNDVQRIVEQAHVRRMIGVTCAFLMEQKGRDIMKKPILLAHRGFSGNYPENSPLAFQMAVEKTAADGLKATCTSQKTAS